MGGNGCPRTDHHTCHFGDRRQCLTTKSERADVLEILRDPQLAGGMR